MPDVISLPHCGGQWMAPPRPWAPPPCAGCVGLGGELRAAQKAGDVTGEILIRERIIRHFMRRHGIGRRYWAEDRAWA